MQSKHLQIQDPWESVSEIQSIKESKHLQIQQHALMIVTALTSDALMQLDSAEKQEGSRC